MASNKNELYEIPNKEFKKSICKYAKKKIKNMNEFLNKREHKQLNEKKRSKYRI